MRILVDIGHPAHVHFYRHAISRLQREGHEVRITARAKDVAADLLAAFGLPFQLLSNPATSRFGMALEFPLRVSRLALLVRRYRPHVLTAVGGLFVAPAGQLTSTPTLVFTDTEHVALDRWLTYPLATRICTPYTFLKALGRVQERYSGLQELAYLHPDYFRADPGQLRTLGLGPEEPYSVVRFVSWRATHDVGQRGFTDAQKRDAVERLGRLGRVFVSTEGERAPVPPERLHDLLAGARLYLGEGATMATEAGLLGTPSIYVSSLVGTMGNFETLRAESLVESFTSAAAALERATALAEDVAAKPAWQARARAFALRHDDVTDLVCRRLVELGAKRAALENTAGRA